MTKSQIQSILHKGLLELSKKHSHLINLRVKEESINFHLANILDRRIKKMANAKLAVDIEFDKHLWEEKIVHLPKRVKIRPDIIFHQRGKDTNNLLVIECKKGLTSKHDRLKILALLTEPYRYKFGALVSYHPLGKYLRLVLYYKEYRKIFREQFLIEK